MSTHSLPLSAIVWTLNTIKDKALVPAHKVGSFLKKQALPILLVLWWVGASTDTQAQCDSWFGLSGAIENNTMWIDAPVENGDANGYLYRVSASYQPSILWARISHARNIWELEQPWVVKFTKYTETDLNLILGFGEDSPIIFNILGIVWQARGEVENAYNGYSGATKANYLGGWVEWWVRAGAFTLAWYYRYIDYLNDTIDGNDLNPWGDESSRFWVKLWLLF